MEKIISYYKSLSPKGKKISIACGAILIILLIELVR